MSIGQLLAAERLGCVIVYLLWLAKEGPSVGRLFNRSGCRLSIGEMGRDYDLVHHLRGISVT